MVVPRARSARDPAARIAWRRVVVYRRTAWYAVAGPDDGLLLEVEPETGGAREAHH